LVAQRSPREGEIYANLFFSFSSVRFFSSGISDKANRKDCISLAKGGANFLVAQRSQREGEIYANLFFSFSSVRPFSLTRL